MVPNAPEAPALAGSGPGFGYAIERMTNTTPWTQIGTAAANAVSYIDADANVDVTPGFAAFDATGAFTWNIEWLVAMLGLIAGMWPGWTKSRERARGAAIRRIVRERSWALIPVEIPSLASTDTMNSDCIK